MLQCGIGPAICAILPKSKALEAAVVQRMLARAGVSATTAPQHVAEQVGVSDAKVMKLAKKPGFSGTLLPMDGEGEVVEPMRRPSARKRPCLSTAATLTNMPALTPCAARRILQVAGNSEEKGKGR